MEVRSGGSILHQVYFRDIDAVGGSYGIFLPQNQPFKDFFIAKKEGDYDGRLLMVDKEGSLFNFPGGSYFITADKKFIIGGHEVDDGASLIVIDVVQRKVVIDGEKLGLSYPDQWYADRLGYFYTENEENNPTPDSNQKTTTIYRLDLKHMRVIKGVLPIEKLNSAHKIDDDPWRDSTDCTSKP